MLKTCTYCGRIHDSKVICKEKAARTKRTYYRKKFTDQQNIRNSNAWKKKSVAIRKRDNYMCQACINGIGYMPGKKITTKNIQVHHIIPLEEDKNMAFMNEYLISLCEQCHELAEAGKISREKLLEIARKQESMPREV